MAKNINDKKALAEKLKKQLNSPQYVEVPDLLRDGDWGADLDFYEGIKSIRQQRRGFIDELDEPLIYQDQLEPADWTEIISLIKTRNAERQKNYKAKKKKIDDKVKSQPDLFYYYGSGSKNKRSNSIIDYGDKKGRYFEINGNENGRSFVLAINSKHPVLDNFPWGKHGYYLIKTDKPIERNDSIIRPWSDGGESKENNFYKWVEVGDQITITLYEVSDKPVEKPNQNYSKEKCATCGMEIIGADYYKVDGKVYHSGCDRLDNKNDSSNQPTKKVSQKEEKKVIEWLTQYLKQHSIKKISLKNGELIITHNNNNEIITDKQLTNNLEYRLLKSNLEKIGKNEPSSQELGIGVNNTSQPSNNKYLWLVGGISIGVIIAGIVGFLYLSHKRKNK